MVGGIYSKNEENRKEIMDLILSTYYDKTLKVNIEESLYHTIDLSNSEFKISGVTMNLASYTLGGNAMEKEDDPNFIISTIPISNDFDLKKYSDRLIYKYQNNIYEEKSINITILSESDYKEGESRIIKVEMLGVLKGQKQKIYQFLKYSPKGIYQFIGTDFSKDSRYMIEFKKIAQNVKLK